MRVLVVVDVQNDFISGPLGRITAQSIIPHRKSRIKDYADAGDTGMITIDNKEIAEAFKKSYIKTHYGEDEE